LLEIQLLRASLHGAQGFKCGLAAYIACLPGSCFPGSPAFMRAFPRVL
jgi:hypothetical protein